MANHSLYTLSKTSTTLITPNGTHSGVDLTIQNLSGASTVYIGGAGVNNGNYGHSLAAGKAVSFTIPSKESLHVISSDDGTQVAVLTLLLH